jgi:hypothetical protein
VSKIVWLSPSPLWDDFTGGPAFRRPTVLRFASDAFMQELQGTLESRPAALRGFVARPESWRRPAAGLPPRTSPAASAASAASVSPGTAATVATAAGEPLTFYQPVHGRFYLVTASLACRVPGLPEHTVDLAAGETVTFVIRRIMRNAAGAEREMAWVTRDGATGWTQAPGAGMVEGEERLPMFGTFFQPDNETLRRRLFAGFIPVDRREQYMWAREMAHPQAADAAPAAPGGASSAPEAVDPEDPRVVDFQRAVLDPWVGLLEWYENEPDARVVRAREAAAQASPLILLDLATWLKFELPDVWAVARGESPASTLTSRPAQEALYEGLARLNLWPPNAAGRTAFWAAVRAADDRRADLESHVLRVGEPPSLPSGFTAMLLTADPRQPGLLPGTQAEIDDDRERLHELLDRDEALPEDAPLVHRRPLVDLLLRALAEAHPPATGTASGSGSGVSPGAGTGAPRLPALPPLDAQGDDDFVIRCAYFRPQCGRNAAPLVSEASERFRLASFFDPDAPQRTIRVALPVDTTPAALRRYDRNVAFVLSNELRKQISRVKGIKELMDGDVGPPGGIDVSVICSLSIPIITICALILLMLIVSLLNFVFWWIPFFISCFPVPSLKAKK